MCGKCFCADILFIHLVLDPQTSICCTKETLKLAMPHLLGALLHHACCTGHENIEGTDKPPGSQGVLFIMLTYASLSPPVTQKSFSLHNDGTSNPLNASHKTRREKASVWAHSKETGVSDTEILNKVRSCPRVMAGFSYHNIGQQSVIMLLMIGYII